MTEPIDLERIEKDLRKGVWFRNDMLNTIAELRAAREIIAKLKDAVKPVLAEAKERADYMAEDYNPEAHIELTLTVKEIRVIAALAAKGKPDDK